MIEHELNECMDTLLELFPEAEFQDAEIKLFRDELKRFERAEVLDVLRSHRMHNDQRRPKMAVVYGILRKRRAEKFAEQIGHREPSLADVIRRQWDMQAGQMPDAEVYLRYYAGLWRGALTRTDGLAERYRRQLSERLSQCGIEAKRAEELAAWITHETLTKEVFQDLVEEVKGAAAAG